MKNLRKHGKSPFQIAVIHGGSGAAGQMFRVAQKISHNYGILEPLQTSTSIEGQIKELHIILEKYGSKQFILIGHSWGAWLAFLYASNYPESVKKILLVSSGPFEEYYASQIMDTRLSRLNDKEKIKLNKLIDVLNNPYGKDKNIIFSRLGKLLSKTDSYLPLYYSDEATEYRYDIFQGIWNDAEELRRCRKLLMAGKRIQCPVVAIHGDYDPHPFKGVEEPLAHLLKDFKFILLKNCGHYPWLERDAKERFYKILYEELS
ncbi:MAG: alpha/beta hydrolase [Candidatus Thermoplasmatota archaeon]|nr:alpha/beta hydrolase [Candidatus Thermoplasmatota archaeon]